MMKRKVMKKHSRHIALLTAIVLAFSNVGTCLNVSLAEEITSGGESGSGSESGGESGSGSESGGGSGSGSESGGESGSGSESGGGSGSGSESGEGSGSGSEGGEGSGSGSESGEGSGTEGEGGEGSGSGNENGEGSGTEGEDGEGSESGSENGEGSGTEGEGGEEAGDEVDGSASGGAAGGNGAVPGTQVDNEEKNKEFTITYSINPEDAAEVEGETLIKEGEELSFTVKPVDGYVIQNVTANGYELTAEIEEEDDEDSDFAGMVTYVVTDVEENLDVEVELGTADVETQDEVLISTTAEDGAVITVSGSYEAMKDISSVKAETIDDTQAFIDELNVELESRGERVDQIAVYDVSVIDAEGNEIQPGAEVNVIIYAPEIINSSNDIGAFHAKESMEEGGEYNIEIKDVSVNKSEEVVTIETTSFSPIGAFSTVPIFDRSGTTDYVSGESKWNASLPEIKETSQGIIFEVDKANKTVNVIIPADYSGDIYINATDALLEAWDGTYVPGGASDFYSINVVNNSTHNYSYNDGSMVISTIDQSYNPDTDYMYDFESGIIDGGAYITTAKCFDGNVPHYSFAIARTDNLALRSLYKTTSRLSKAQLVDSAIEKKLIEIGYENGIVDLDNYYLDFYNQYYGETYTKLEDLSDTQIVYTPNGEGIFGGYVLGGSKAQNQIKETNAQIAELGYNFFYNRLVGIAPESASVYAAGTYGAYNGVADYSIGAYMRGDISYNDICLRDIGAINAGQEAALEAMGFYISGPYCTNPFQNYDFAFSIAFELIQTDNTTPPTPPTPPSDGGNGGGGGGGGGTTPGGHRATPETNGPGVTIEPEAVPLAPLPESVTIEPEDVPLAPLPKTGQKPVTQWICLMSGLMLGLYGILGRKKEENL